MFKYRINSEYTVKVFVLLVARWSVDKKKNEINEYAAKLHH